MRFTLSTKIILLLQVALCFALTFTAVLSYLKVERIVEGTVASRFAVTARGLSNEIEAAIGLGVPLAALRNLDGLIQRSRSLDDRITGLVVFNARGEVLAASGRAVPKSVVPADWLASFQRAGAERSGTVTDGDTQILLRGVRDAIGGVAGGVALTYSLHEVRAGVHDTIPTLVVSGAINLVTCLLVTMVAVWFVLRPIQRRLREVAECVEAAMRHEDHAIPAELAGFAPGLEPFLARVRADGLPPEPTRTPPVATEAV